MESYKRSSRSVLFTTKPKVDKGVHDFPFCFYNSVLLKLSTIVSSLELVVFSMDLWLGLFWLGLVPHGVVDGLEGPPGNKCDGFTK